MANTRTRRPPAGPAGDEPGLFRGEAAGVPFVARPPLDPARADAAIVVAWHMLDSPRTAAAFAAALPLDGLDAWRIYLELPWTGSRLPAGGWDDLMRRGYDDAVLSLQQPIIEGAAAEFPAALAALRDRFAPRAGPVGVLGGSTGAAVAQLVVADGLVEASAAVLVSPIVQLRKAVDEMARGFGFTYPWTDSAAAVADRLDFVARAAGIAGRPAPPAVLLLAGEDDDPSIREPAEGLTDALRAAGVPDERVRFTAVPGMAHALADEPGTEPAPQTPHAAVVDRLAVEWFHAHLLAER